MKIHHLSSLILCLSPSLPPPPSFNSWLIFDLNLLWTALPLYSSTATRLNILCYSALVLMASTQLLPLLVCLHHQRSAALEPDHWNSSNHNFNAIIIVILYNLRDIAAYWIFILNLTSLCHQKYLRTYLYDFWWCMHEVIMPNSRHLLHSPCLLFAY